MDENGYLDLSHRNLHLIPKLSNKLTALYLNNNRIQTLPEDFFLLFPNLVWLDLRDNLLQSIPKSIENHSSLTHLLLQNNNITSLPDELGTVKNLKVLLLSGNKIEYPPSDILNKGLTNIIEFLFKKHTVNSGETIDADEKIFHYSSNLNRANDNKAIKLKSLSVHCNRKSGYNDDNDFYAKIKGKCPKLAKSRRISFPSHYQSSKYLKPLITCDSEEFCNRIKDDVLREQAVKKHKELLANRDKVIQNRKNMELLKNWQYSYKLNKFNCDGSYRLRHFPYDIDPENMVMLTRKDIKKDLPNKYRKRLTNHVRLIPRNMDSQLNIKIKNLQDSLGVISLQEKSVSPKTVQKMLLREMKKITEIKQEVSKLSLDNTKSVTPLYL